MTARTIEQKSLRLSFQKKGADSHLLDDRPLVGTAENLAVAADQ